MNGIFPLNQLPSNQIKQKYCQGKEAYFNVSVAHTPEEFHPTKFDRLETELVKESGSYNKRWSRSIGNGG